MKRLWKVCLAAWLLILGSVMGGVLLEPLQVRAAQAKKIQVQFKYTRRKEFRLSAGQIRQGDTGKVTLTDDLNEGCVVAVSYDAEGRVTGIGVLRTKTDFVVLNLQDTCRLFLLNASSAPRLNTPITINDYLQT